MCVRGHLRGTHRHVFHCFVGKKAKTIFNKGSSFLPAWEEYSRDWSSYHLAGIAFGILAAWFAPTLGVWDVSRRRIFLPVVVALGPRFAVVPQTFLPQSSSICSLQDPSHGNKFWQFLPLS